MAMPRNAIALFAPFTAAWFAACAEPSSEATAPSLAEVHTRCASGPAPSSEEGSAATWRWTKLGPASGLPEASASGDGILSPAALEHEGAIHLWFATKVGSRHTLFHAISRDGGSSFADVLPVAGLEGHIGAYPSVWREDGQFAMVYGSGSIKRATSVDGVHFAVDPSPVLRASFAEGRFDALSVIYPSRVSSSSPSDGPGAGLFFTGYDGQKLRIGRAVAQADGTFAVDPPRPVLELGAGSDFDNSAVAQPHVHQIAGQFWMWYGGYDTSHSNPGPYRIGSASSADGVTWKKHGVAIELAESGSDAWSTRDPAVLRTGPGWSMFYVGLGDDGRYRLHRAAAGICADR